MRTHFLPLIIVCLLLPAAVAQDDLKQEEQQILSALRGGGSNQLAQVVAGVASKNSPAAADLLFKVASTPSREYQISTRAHWILLNGIASMTNESALMRAAELIVGKKSHFAARDLLGALTNTAQKAVVPAMCYVLQRGEDDMKVVAADHLIAIGDERAVEALITALGRAREGGTLRYKIGQALTAITKRDYGDSVSNWQGWWEQNKGSFKAGEWTGGTPAGSTVTGGLDRARRTEYERLKKTGKILVIQAGDYCCGDKGEHDLDHLDQISFELGLEVDVIDKIDL
ncbi:MAG: hypothetical protein ACYTAF_11825, partial [Planctomycetota bacterium]